MSELIQKNDNRATIRWKLLTGASALALISYVSATATAKADDADRPTLWIELGGDVDLMQGLAHPFTADFMSIIPTPDVYKQDSLTSTQRPPRFTFGGNAKITFQPEDSDWIFSAGIRYGRSHSNRHIHHQSAAPTAVFTFYFAYYHTNYQITNKFARQMFADTRMRFDESHAVLDFQAGKDVGLGLFGRDGTSTLNAGVRFAQFRTRETLNIYARPNIQPDAVYHTLFSGYLSVPYLFPNFHVYGLEAGASRSFQGVGPSISWNASAPLAGNEQSGALTFDWGIDAAVLFGKQKAKVHHATQGYHYFVTNPGIHSNIGHYDKTLDTGNVSDRSRSVTVPHHGGFAALSWHSQHAKVSLGYRYDAFLNAMDTGIDARKTSNLTFNGPYASISIGLGD